MSTTVRLICLAIACSSLQLLNLAEAKAEGSVVTTQEDKGNFSTVESSEIKDSKEGAEGIFLPSNHGKSDVTPPPNGGTPPSSSAGTNYRN